MPLEAPSAYFILMIAVIGIAALPMLRFLDDPHHLHARFAALDGLRGMLALGVFVFHLVVTHRFIETGRWEVPSSTFYALLGPVGVSLFFMITGFLFWRKLLHAQGQPDWRALYIGRLFRIGPMYLFVVLVMLAIVFTRTGFRLLEPADVVTRAVLQWLALGLVDTQPDVNGYNASHVLAGVTWTIWYEWVFYVSLVATAPFARGRLHPILIGVALVGCLAGKMLLHIDALGFALLFVCGMGVASLLHANPKARLPPAVASAIAIACLLVIFLASTSGYGTLTAVLLALFFYLVCSGTSLFGLLTSRPAHRLGAISYSLYLMQGLVLSIVFAFAPVRAFALATPLNYWIVGIVCAAVLVISAALGYAFIERPAIALGKRWASRPRVRVDPSASTAR